MKVNFLSSLANTFSNGNPMLVVLLASTSPNQEILERLGQNSDILVR